MAFLNAAVLSVLLSPTAPYAVALNVTSGNVGGLVLATMSLAAGHGSAGVAAANAGGATIAPATANPVLSTSRRVSPPSMGHLPLRREVASRRRLTRLLKGL